MKNLKKGLFTLSFTFVMVMALGVVNVNAQEYNLMDEMSNLMAGNPLEINVGDTLTYGDEEWIGRNGRLNVTSGTLTITYNDGGTPITAEDYDNPKVIAEKITDDMVNFTIDGITVVNPDKRFIVQANLSSVYPGVIIPINLTVNEDAQLYVNGRLAMPSGANSVLVNNGTVNVSEAGTMELRDRANIYQGDGELLVFGKLAMYGNSGSNINDHTIKLYAPGVVYSAFDIVDNIVVGNMSSEYIQFSLIEAEDKSYESTSDNVGLQEFSYAYTVISEQIKDFPEVPVTPEEDTTTEEGTSTENVENPETSDGIALFLGLTIVGFAGVALTYRRLHN